MGIGPFPIFFVCVGYGSDNKRFDSMYYDTARHLIRDRVFVGTGKDIVGVWHEELCSLGVFRLY